MEQLGLNKYSTCSPLSVVHHWLASLSCSSFKPVKVTSLIQEHLYTMVYHLMIIFWYLQLQIFLSSTVHILVLFACKLIYFFNYFFFVIGYYSFRNASHGSWFIQELCTVLEENLHKGYDLFILLTLTCQRIAFIRTSNVPNDRSKHKKKQMPYLVSTLTRLVRFDCVQQQLQPTTINNFSQKENIEFNDDEIDEEENKKKANINNNNQIVIHSLLPSIPPKRISGPMKLNKK